MRIKLDWGQDKEPKKPKVQTAAAQISAEPHESGNVPFPDWQAITSKNIIGPPGHPRIRVKVTPQTARYGSSPHWVSYTLNGGTGPQAIKVQYPKSAHSRPRSILVKDEQLTRLSKLLKVCQTPLPGEVSTGCTLDGDVVEVSISGPGLLANYRWEGGPPWQWEGLGEIAKFLTNLAGEGIDG